MNTGSFSNLSVVPSADTGLDWQLADDEDDVRRRRHGRRHRDHHCFFILFTIIIY